MGPVLPFPFRGRSSPCAPLRGGRGARTGFLPAGLHGSRDVGVWDRNTAGGWICSGAKEAGPAPVGRSVVSRWAGPGLCGLVPRFFPRSGKGWMVRETDGRTRSRLETLAVRQPYSFQRTRGSVSCFPCPASHHTSYLYSSLFLLYVPLLGCDV